MSSQGFYIIGTDPDALVDNKESLLHFAIGEKRLDQVADILDNGADPSARQSSFGVSPLHYAIQLNQNQCVRLLLDANADPNILSLSKTLPPLLTAISVGNIEAIEMLLQAGADPSLDIGKGQTPLWYAIEYQNPQALQLLLQYHAKFDPNDSQLIFLAVRKENPECLRLMIQAGMNLDVCNAKNNTPFEVASSLDNPTSELFLGSLPLPDSAAGAEFVDFLDTQIQAEVSSSYKKMQKGAISTEALRALNRRLVRFDQYVQLEMANLDTQLQKLAKSPSHTNDDSTGQLMEKWYDLVTETQKLQRDRLETSLADQSRSTVSRWMAVTNGRIEKIEGAFNATFDEIVKTKQAAAQTQRLTAQNEHLQMLSNRRAERTIPFQEAVVDYLAGASDDKSQDLCTTIKASLPQKTVKPPRSASGKRPTKKRKA